MKLTKKFVKQFEIEQEQFGTETALANVLWFLAADILHGVGVKNIKTTYWKDSRKGTKKKS